MGLSRNFAHWWLSEECAYTFSIFVKLGESIFSALIESGRFFVSDEADRSFVSPPPRWSVALRFLSGKTQR